MRLFTLLRAIAPLIVAGSFAAPAAAFDTSARSALVVDMKSGATLLSKNAEEPLPPASMSKLMTLNMVFEALQEGRLSMDDTFRVSEKAWKMGGSRMFAREGDSIRIEDLIRGVVVQSGNDACVVLAEGLAGSEEAFAERMNERARELGMLNSTFANSTGWPHPDHRMSAEDLMILIGRMVTEFEEYYPYWAETEFTWDGVTQKNRNPLLYLDLGADGLKTGHTEEAGYGLTGSAIRDGRRISFVITGLESNKDRSVESERLLTWAFREFKTDTVATAGQIVGEARVWMGADATVPLTPAEDVIATASYAGAEDMDVRIRYDGPVAAPIAIGDPIGEMIVSSPDVEPISVPLVAAAAVDTAGPFIRAVTALKVLISSDEAEAPEPAE